MTIRKPIQLLTLMSKASLMGVDVASLRIRAAVKAAVIITLLAGSVVMPATVLADNHLRTRAEAVEIAKQRSNNGTVLSVKKVQDKNGNPVYAIKIISKGRVKVYKVSEKP